MGQPTEASQHGSQNRHEAGGRQIRESTVRTKPRYVFKTHKNKMVRPDDGRRSAACKRRYWIAQFATEDMGVTDGEVTRGEMTLLNMAVDLAMKDKPSESQRHELRDIIGMLRRGRGKRA